MWRVRRTGRTKEMEGRKVYKETIGHLVKVLEKNGTLGSPKCIM